MKDYVILCPAHDDTKPSLSLTRTGDKWLWHCHAGCTQEAVLAALKKSGALDTLNLKAQADRLKPFHGEELKEKSRYILQTSNPAPDSHPYLLMKRV